MYNEFEMYSSFMYKVQKWLSIVSFQDFYDDI